MNSKAQEFVVNGALELLICPRCRHDKLVAESGKLHCTGCQTDYPVVEDIPNFLLRNSNEFQNPRWVEAQNHEKAFWDEVKRTEAEFDAGPGRIFWKKHAEEQYRNFLRLRNGQPARTCLEIGGGKVPR